MSDSQLPCRAHAIPDNAVLLKATAQHGRRETACGLLDRVRLLPDSTRNSTKLSSDAYQSLDAVGQCETKHRLHGRGKVVAAHYKKDDLLHCWTSSSDISGYHADIHEGHGTVGAGQGRGTACVN